MRHAGRRSGIHLRVILRHADVTMMMEVCAQANSTAASETLPRLGSPSDEHRCGKGLIEGRSVR